MPVSWKEDEVSMTPRQSTAEERACTTCYRVLPLSSFTRWRPQCRDCKLAIARKNGNKNRPSGKRRPWQNTEKTRARAAVKYALKSGKLIRMGCEVCGGKAHAHHEDYSKPLEVRWLCAMHHGREHRREIPVQCVERLAIQQAKEIKS